MPLEVRIDVVPNDIDALRKRIGLVRIVQVERLDDDPEGERIYEVTGARKSRVQHRRGDGAGVLVALAIASDLGPDVPTERADTAISSPSVPQDYDGSLGGVQ